MATDNKKSFAAIITVIKMTVILFIGVFIYLKLKDEQNLNPVLYKEVAESITTGWPILTMVVLLMPANWLLEAKKWTILARPIKKISLKEALTGVLAGLSIGFITPHGIGDYIGRILILRNKSRGELLGGIMLGRLMQLLATLLFGTIGIYFLLGISFMSVYLIMLACLVLTGILLLYLPIKLPFSWFAKITYFTRIIKSYSVHVILHIFLLSLARYVVFCLQFVITLSVFVDMPHTLKVAGTTWIFLTKSVIPTFNFLSDLGVREFSAVYFFDNFGVPLVPVLSASLLVWGINILMPTMAGAPLVMKLKPRL